MGRFLLDIVKLIRIQNSHNTEIKKLPKPPKIRATAIDLFCGAGGLTRGLLSAGLNVVAGYDIDKMCRFPYEHNNPGAKFHQKSIASLKGKTVARRYPKGHTRILVGCAPCQTFSKYTQGLENESDPKWTLLKDFGRLIRELKPDIVSMENVPELQRHQFFKRSEKVGGLLPRLWGPSKSSSASHNRIASWSDRTPPAYSPP